MMVSVVLAANTDDDDTAVLNTEIYQHIQNKLTENNKLTNILTDRQLIWADEFNQNSLNANNWDAKTVPQSNNNEKQYYTSRTDNVFVSNGQLTLRAKPEVYGNKKFTSGKVVTKGRREFKYGRVEIRAKLPTGQGMWPAFWLMPVVDNYGEWPNSGEIDIMEHVSCSMGNIYSTIHCGAYNWPMHTEKQGMLVVPTVADWHVYALEWTEDKLEAFVDNQRTVLFLNDKKNDPMTWPFNKKFYIILNVAVAGDWGGFCLGGKNPVFSVPEGDFVIDYVRLYAPLSSTPTTPTTPVPTTPTASGVCTSLNNDPWSTGVNVPCCTGTKSCLKDWLGNGNWAYRCIASASSC
jgi:beta-glucanase (GH16 family)